MKQFLVKTTIKVAVAATVLAILNVQFVEAATAGGVAKVKPCASMGKTVALAGKPVDSCATFYRTGSAIHIEKDSTTVRYGVVLVTLTQPPQTATLINRDGVSVPLPINLVPMSLHADKTAAQYIFRAGVRKSKIVSLKPVLFVPTSTMVKPFGNTQFIGTVNNLQPSDGIDASAWVRWNFLKLNKKQELQGKFVNLNSAVRSSPIMEPPAPCQAPLNNGDVSTSWYSRILGTSDGLSMSWNPAMHTPLDSELVIAMGSGITYMTSTPSINVLMKSNMDTGRPYSFTIHGNPMGTPYQFTGSFSAQTPVRPCSVN